MSTFKKINIGLFAILFGIVSIAMTNTDAQQENIETQIAEQVTLNGTVVDATTQNPLPNVEVTITEMDETFETNDKGEFTAEGLATGKTYTLTIDEDGYQDYEKEIETTNIESPTIDIVVKLKPEENK